MLISSTTEKMRGPSDHHIDAAVLPNPHQEPGLRPRDGKNRLVRDWLMQHPETIDLIDVEVAHILDRRPSSVVVTCSAGKHRSVFVAEELASRLREHGLAPAVVHEELERKAAGKKGPKLSRQERGYDARHYRQREYLLAQHEDGAPCDICGEPMFKDAEHNRDGAPLEADHKEGDKTEAPYRLLHRHCNRSISNKWVHHGVGWIEKFGIKNPSRLDGTLTVW